MTGRLSFGGPKAWAYKQLSGNLAHKLNLVMGVKVQKSFILPKLKSHRDDQQYLIVDGNSFIDTADIEYIANKVKWLGKPKAVQLLQEFGSIDNIRRAGVLELQKIEGIGQTLSNRIKESL